MSHLRSRPFVALHSLPLVAALVLLATPPTRAQPSPDAPADPPLTDRDGDGVPDSRDACPDEPEDTDGFQDDDGCPDLDNDQDHIPDCLDSCPEEAETANGFLDDDGCPDAIPAGGAPADARCATANACHTAANDAWHASDLAGAVAGYRRACLLGAPSSCASYGIVLEQGTGVAKNLDGAARVYRWACAGGSKEACGNLAVMLRDGRGVAQSEARARIFYGRACDLGLAAACSAIGRAPPAAPAPGDPGPCTDGKTCTDRALQAFSEKRGADAFRDAQRGCDLGAADACGLLGRLYDTGMGVDKDEARALAIDQRACPAGSQPACHNLAMRYLAGRLVEKDPAKARQMLDAACKTGLKPSCNELSKLTAAETPVAQPAPDQLAGVDATYERKDYVAVVKLCKPLCDKGNAEACAWLGSARWEQGQTKVGFELWTRGCQGKIGWACSELADVYWSGDIGPADHAKGFAYAKMACEFGDPEGCSSAGAKAYGNAGPGVQGVAWFLRGCDLKDAANCSMAAHSYREGDFGPQDPALALRYEGLACDLGKWTECTILGLSYRDGVGTAPDRARARKYLELACQNKDDLACRELKSL